MQSCKKSPSQYNKIHFVKYTSYPGTYILKCIVQHGHFQCKSLRVLLYVSSFVGTEVMDTKLFTSNVTFSAIIWTLMEAKVLQGSWRDGQSSCITPSAKRTYCHSCCQAVQDGSENQTASAKRTRCRSCCQAVQDQAMEGNLGAARQANKVQQFLIA